MRDPDWTVVRSAKAAPGDKGIAIRQPLSFDEQLVESGMRAIRSMRRKSEFDVTGQLQSNGLRDVFTKVTRRTSASSSAEMTISVNVSHGPLRRRNSALSGVKLQV